MGRAIGGVLAAFALWTALWLGFTQVMTAVFPDVVDPALPLTHTGALLAYVAYSAVISALAGWVCAAVKGPAPMRTVWVFAGVQLVVGVGFEISYWAMTPVWYHLVFLALIVPATVWGGALKARSHAPRAAEGAPVG
jgi:hypothetical protein